MEVRKPHSRNARSYKSHIILKLYVERVLWILDADTFCIWVAWGLTNALKFRTHYGLHEHVK